MSKKVRRWLFISGGAFLILIGGILIANLLKPQPTQIGVDIPPAPAIEAAVSKMYVVQDAIYCIPGTSIDALSGILVDSSDYLPSFQEFGTIVKVYGVQGLSHAGYLTSQLAYFQSRINPPQVTPPPGLIPTLPPAIYCPDMPYTPELSFDSIALEGENKAIAQYSYVGHIYEAVLRQIDGVWMIAGIKLIYWGGNG